MNLQEVLFDRGRLSQLKDLAVYPCADVYPMAQSQMLEEFGIDTSGDSVFRELIGSRESERERTEEVYFDLVFKEKESGSIKIPINWGIQRKFLKRLNIETLEEIHYGTRNLRVPTEMLDLENPFEIISNYLAAGILKPCNRHQKDDVPRKRFSDVVKFMNSFSYDNGIFRAASHQFSGSNRFPINSGYQKKRLASLSGEIKRQFCASFFKNNIPSRREEPDNPNAFFVPRTWNQKIDNIMGYFSERFQRERT